MRFLLIVTVLITLATVVLLAGWDSPTLRIVFGGWIMELHPSALLPFFLIVFFILYIVFGALFAIKRLPEKYRRRRILRNLRRKNVCLEKGMLSLIEGDWSRAGRFLGEGARLSDRAPVYQLGLAQVADHEGRLADRQTHLVLARHADKRGSLGAALTQARLLHARSDNAAAIACLLEVREAYPRSRELNDFLLDLLQSEKRWEEVLMQLPYCRLPEETQRTVQKRAYKHLLRQSAAVGDIKMLRFHWKRMPGVFRRSGEMIRVYARACLQCGDIAGCESLLRKQLRDLDTVDADLAMLYSMLPAEGMEKRIRYVEKLLEKRGQDPGLLFIAGIVYLRLNQQQRGMEKLQNSARLASWPEVCHLLARLSERDGDFAAAAKYYKMVSGFGSDDGGLLSLLSVTGESSDTAGESLIPSGQKAPPA